MRLTLPKGDFQAYLFDLDGTITNSLPLHFQAWNQALAPYGVLMPEELFYAWGGIPVPRTVEMLNERFGTAMPVDLVARAREEAYFESLDQVESHAAVEAIIRQTHGRLPMAVVSGSSRAAIERTLDHLSLRDLFPLIVGAEDCQRGKPDPEPYLTAARRLGVNAGSCLVFEDAEPGIESALKAGMQVVRIPQRPE